MPPVAISFMGDSSPLNHNLKARNEHRLARLLAIVFFGGFAIVVTVAAWLYWRTREALPKLDGTAQVRGLRARVEVRRDAHGVPHITAQSLDDLFFAQGYVTAQDRLFQMDLSRRLAMGQLGEILGKQTLRMDIQNRTLGLPEAAHRAAQDLDAQSRELMNAYAAGVNEFISSHRGRLPIEFLLLGYQPRPWRTEDSFGVALNMSKSLNNSWEEDLDRERIRAKVTPELYRDLFPDHSDYDHPVPGLALPRVARGRNTHLTSPALADETLWSSIPGALPFPADSFNADLGSNDWVVSGAHTLSGKPLLANDPHLAHSIPSVWYMVHLEAPGLDVSGVSLPGLPLVIIGHNQRIAWGMTNTGPDVQDLFEETFDPTKPNKYLYKGEWKDAEVRRETIHVKRGADYTFTVKNTVHGPVISQAGGRNLALQWTALEPGALRFPFLKIDTAQNWQEFTEALRDFTGPMQNFVYADVDGNIGYYAAGWVPIRKKGDGSVPVPGASGDYDWTGYIPFENLPHSFNPASGIIATANGRIVPDQYPYFITREWAAPFRTARIYQLLESNAKFSVHDMLRIQTDIESLEDLWLAKQLVAAAEKDPPSSDDARYAISLLKNYDGEATADSAATLVCEETRIVLLERILKPKLGEDLSGYNWSMSSVFLQNVINHRSKRWLPPGDADFNVTLIKSLEDAVGKIPGLAGLKGLRDWRWGRTIPLTFRNNLTIAFPFLSGYLNVGPVPQAGTHTTVKQTTLTVGPSMRMVVDFSNFENSIQNITLGESGQFLSPYYKDQFNAWYHGRSFPMRFGDDSVEKHTLHDLVLEPAGPSSPTH